MANVGILKNINQYVFPEITEQKRLSRPHCTPTYRSSFTDDLTIRPSI